MERVIKIDTMQYPRHVELCEVGPRDGFQFEEKPIPTSLKIEIVRDLVSAGISRIQLTSFVHPERVPQMADAEQLVDVFRTVPGVRFSGLALNARGVERAAASGLTHVDLSIATNERHGMDNTNMSVREGIDAAHRMIDLGHREGLNIQLGFQTVFGYSKPGDTPLEDILMMAGVFAEAGLESLSLADSTGLANPESIRRTIEAVRTITGDLDLVLHLHDTRGLGLANVTAALEMGVTRFDTSMGGLGGCPFIPGATGNIATEDTVWLLDQLGIDSGISIPGVSACSRSVSKFLGRPLSGKLYNLS